MKGFLFLGLLTIMGLTSSCQMLREVNASTSAIHRNRCAIERSTQAIEANVAALERITGNLEKMETE